MMNFAVFILSHKRAERVETYDALRKSGYTGDIIVVIDDEDEQRDIYRKRFGKELVIFNKQRYIDSSDAIYPKEKRGSALYARNFIESVAKASAYDGFVMIDDDITSFRYRWVDDDSVKSLCVGQLLDKVFEYYINYMKDAKIATTSFPFSMFFVSGVSGLDTKISESRHTYEIHIRNTDFPVEWKSVINQDTITELLTMQRGYIWWSIPFVVIDGLPMNRLSGGLKSVYDSISDFDKAFLAVITNPSGCKIAHSNGTRSSMYIKENKHTTYPMIVSGRYKK